MSDERTWPVWEEIEPAEPIPAGVSLAAHLDRVGVVGGNPHPSETMIRATTLTEYHVLRDAAGTDADPPRDMPRGIFDAQPPRGIDRDEHWRSFAFFVARLRAVSGYLPKETEIRFSERIRPLLEAHPEFDGLRFMNIPVASTWSTWASTTDLMLKVRRKVTARLTVVNLEGC